MTRELRRLTARGDSLVLFSLLFDVADFLGELLQSVFVCAVLQLEIWEAFQSPSPGTQQSYGASGLPCCFFAAVACVAMFARYLSKSNADG